LFELTPETGAAILVPLSNFLAANLNATSSTNKYSEKVFNSCVEKSVDKRALLQKIPYEH